MGNWPTVARVGLPAEATNHLDGIKADLHGVLERWDAVTAQAGVARDVTRIILQHVPETLVLYSQIPDDMRTVSRRQSSPTERVTASLALLDRHLDEVRAAAYKGDLDALVKQSFYLDERYQLYR